MDSVALDRAGMRQLLALKTKLGSNIRHFVLSEDVIEKSGKAYIYTPHDIRLLRFASGAMGSNSDCFILYAVAKLGICDMESIRLFLKSIKKISPTLQLGNLDDKDSLKPRLHALFKNGFLFKISYPVETYDQKKEMLVEDNVQLYTIDKESQSFMNQKLGKKVAVNTWIQAKPIYEMIGWASAAYVGASLANQESFVEYKEGIFRSRTLGTVMVPCELKMEGAIYVMCMPAFLYHDKRIHTENEYLDLCLFKINTVLNYLSFRKDANKLPRVVVVVESNADLESFGNLIAQSEVLIPYLSEIYFVGEGIIRNGDVTTMLQMKITAEGELDFIATCPDFL